MPTRYAVARLTQTAYHEAGHAVFACLMNIGFKRVTVAPGPVPLDEFRRTTLGQLDLDGKWPRFALPWEIEFDLQRARNYVRRNVCMTVAGSLAETLYSHCWRQSIGEDGDDEFYAREAASIVTRSPKAARDLVDRVRFLTLEMLRVPYVWAAVEAVAQKLVKRKTLRSAEVMELVSRLMPSESEAERHAKQHVAEKQALAMLRALG